MIHIENIATLSGHQNPIFTVENSQKPGIFFTGGNDKGVVEWSLMTNSFIKVLFPVKSSIYSIHAPIGIPILAVGERSGQVNIFDFEQQKVSATLQHHKLPVFDIKCLCTKNELLVASEDGTLSVWNLNNFSLLHSFKVSSETVRVIAIDPSQKLMALGSKDNIIRIYKLEDYELVYELTDHTLPISSLQFSPDGQYLISGSRDAQIKIWNTTDFSLHKSIPAHLFAIYSICYHPNKPFFATASRDKSIKIWASDDFELKKTISFEKGYNCHRLSINKLCWEPNKEQLISVSDDKLIMIWDVKFDVN